MNQEDNRKNFSLQEAIVKTVAYFDMFDFPLTAWEIWQNLGVKCEFMEVVKALEEDNQLYQVKEKNVEAKNGFYYFFGREEITGIRQSRYNFSRGKFRRAKFIAGIFRFVPWVRLAAVANVFGDHNLKDESDIDLLIVAEKNRLWLARFFCVAIVKFLGLRPDLKRKIFRDRICLSFLISEDGLDLDRVRLKDDIHFAHWLKGLKPIYDQDGTVYEKFIGANGWLNKIFPNWRSGRPSDRRFLKSPDTVFYHDFLDMFFGGLEPQFKKWQLKILPERIKLLMNKGTNVMVNDSLLKLHVNDRREEYNVKYREKVRKMLI